MFSRPLFSIRTTVSTFSRTHRILFLTFAFVLALGGAAISKSPALREALRLSAAPKLSISAQAPLQRTASKKIDLLRMVGVNRASTQPSSFASPLAPSVSATKSDSLFTDVDGDLQADPGDTLKYTVNISASGDDATGVTFTDTVDPNTAFVGGSLRATPVAVDDSYAATGNVRISVAAPGVLGNDFAGVPSATITAPPSTSANGGDVTLNADGSFTYNPPAGFEGTDTFNYTLTNSEGSNSGTVTINVSGMIWFIDNNAAACTTLAAGCGRLTNPFSSLSAFASLNNGAGNNPAANDNIFVYESASDYAGPVTLLSGQRFIGQDATASLSAITGLTPPAGSDPLPTTNSANGTIVNITTGNAITVGSGNTLTGFTGGNSTTDISGTAFGTLTISDVTLNGTGEALNLNTGALNATLGSISSTNSGTTGINLTGVAGNLTSPTTTITNPTGIGISVATSTAILNFGNTTSTLSGGTGVSLSTNTGSITFGSLNISPDANQKGLVATDNSGTITSTSGAISNTGETAIQITRSSGTTPLVISLTSVSSSGGSGTGIILSNTSGSFTVVGDGANTTVGGNGSGGTIANKTGANGSTTTGIGVYLNNTTNVTLRRMTINGTNQNYAVRGTNVTGGGIEYSTINGVNGDNAAIDEGSVIFDGLFGTSTFTNNAIGGSVEDNFRIRNSSGVADVTVTGSTFSNAPNDNLIIEPSATSVVTAHVTNNTFTGAGGDHLQTLTTNSATLSIVFTGNFYSNGFPSSLGGGVTISGGNAGSTETVNFNISNNGSAGSPLVGSVQGGAINVNQTGGGGTWQGQVSGNFIGNPAVTNSGSIQSQDIRVENHSITGTMTAIVNGNTLNQWNSGAAINFQVGDVGNVNAAINLTVTNNVITNPGAASIHGVQGNFGAVAGGSNAVCFDFKTNTVNIGGTPPNGGSDLRLRQRNNSTVRLPGYAGASTDLTAVTNFEVAQNTLTAGSAATQVSAQVQAPGGGFVGGAACNAPIVPLALQQIGEKAAKSSTSEASNGGGSPIEQSNQEATLWASTGERPDGDKVGELSQAELMWMAQAAIERWRTSQISAEDMARLQATTFEVADLPEGQIASATDSRITVDTTAAGYGWYVDVSPMEDLEFEIPVPNREMQAIEFSPAFGRMDLLTAVMRELGVTYRQGKNKLPKQLRPLMENTLSPAVRRLPDSQNIQMPGSKDRAAGKNRAASEKILVSRKGKRSTLRPRTAVATSAGSISNVAFNPSANQPSVRNNRLMHHAPRNRAIAPMLSSMLADVMLSIGTLPAGESVTITFNVTVDDPFGGALPQVSNQGTVSGSNFADVLTDDPTVGGAADPTVTPIDLPDVSVAVSPSSVAEDGATNLVYTFTRDGSPANALTVNFSIGGSASFGASPNDYTQTGAATFSPPTGTVTFGAGNSTATVTVDPETDTTVETDETVVLTVTSGIGYVVGAPSSASGTITNDDTDVSVAVSPASVAEDGATNLVYTFTRAGVTTNSLTVNFSIAVGGTNAVFPVDYAQSGAATFAPPVGTVTFDPGNSTATVTIDPATDAIVEPDETVIFTVTSGAGYNVSSPSSATGTITNDDAEVSVTVAPGSVTEDGATNLVYTFTRTGFTVLPATVNFSVGGSAVFSSGDYTQTGAATYSDTSGTVLFGPGDSTATVTIDPSADLTVEPDETVILTVTSGTGYNVGSPVSATGTIINDDTDVSVAVSPGSVAEDGATNLVYTFTRNSLSAGALTVNFSVGGSASFPADYSQSGAATYSSSAGTVTFGAASFTATVTIDPSADLTVELDETVDITLTSGTGYNVVSPSAASGTITNDDTDVSVAVSPASVAEDGATNLVYTFTRNSLSAGVLTVNFSVGGSAGFPGDYSQSGATTYSSSAGTVTFGAASFTATVTVDPAVDTTIETDETVILTLTSGAGYNVSSPSSATGTIATDDADVSVTVAPAAVTEDGATNLVYTFTRTGFIAGSHTVNFSVGGTAVFGPSPDDYTQTGATTYTTTSGSVTFTPGSPTATVTVNPETDITFESDETVVITLTAGASYNVVSPSSATGTILNDDTLVSVVVAPSSTAEGGPNLVYTFTRTGPTGSALTANVSVGGSAGFPGDYTQSGATTFTPPTATVTFGVGSSTATVTVTPLTDCLVEGSETVVFTVQPGTGYGVGSPSTATGTITNTPDSSAPTITLIPNVNMTLWPPNHQYETVAVTDFVASASDNCDPSVNLNSVYILKITSDEADNGNGDGNTTNDIVIAAGCKTAQLRSERSGNGDGRVYTITFKVKDSVGNFTTATAQVTVRKSPNTPAVDSGTANTVNSGCP